MLAVGIALAIQLAQPALVRADDRVGELAKLISSSSNEKSRLAAVVALAKIGDRTTLKPLVTAAADPSAKIRVVAVVALGRLSHKAALPTLRNLANDDTDDDVRKNARTAAIAVARANNLPDPFAGNPVVADSEPTTPKKARAGFGNQPRVLQARPEVYVVIKTAADDSPGNADKNARKGHADLLRRVLADQCRATPSVTSIASEASRYGLETRNIDLSVTKLDVSRSGGYIEIDAQLRLAISDASGKMLSFLSGGAKVQVRQQTFDAKNLPNLRREALENAMRGMFDKLVNHLREKPKA